MTPLERKQKRLFNAVYQWGRWGVLANYKSPTFQKMLKEINQLTEQEKKLKYEK